MLEAVLNHINMNARIPVCGMISQYNQVSQIYISVTFGYKKHFIGESDALPIEGMG